MNNTSVHFILYKYNLFILLSSYINRFKLSITMSFNKNSDDFFSFQDLRIRTVLKSGI